MQLWVSHKQEQEVALCSDKASSSIHQEQLQQPGVSPTAKSLQVTGLSGLLLRGLPVGCKCYTTGGLVSVRCPFHLLVDVAKQVLYLKQYS